MSVTPSGARVVFRVNGQKVAFAQAMSYNVQHNHAPVDVLDQLTPAEYSETGVVVNFTATLFRVPNQSAMALGLRPRLEDVLTQPELTAELIDRQTGTTLSLIQRVKCTSESFNIEARGLGQTTLEFVGIRQDDEGSL